MCVHDKSKFFFREAKIACYHVVMMFVIHTKYLLLMLTTCMFANGGCRQRKLYWFNDVLFGMHFIMSSVHI